MQPETKAPTLAEMEAMAHEIFERLPKTLQALRGGDHPRRRFPDRRGFGRDGRAKRIRPARPVSGHRPAAAEPWRHCAATQHDLALPPADPGLLGRARR